MTAEHRSARSLFRRRSAGVVRSATMCLCGAALASLAPLASARAPLASPLASSVSALAASAAQEPAAQVSRYVRVKAPGGALTNLPDKNGEALMRAPAGALLAVRSERAGYLEVEPPGGMEVWVFGQYARPTGQAGLIEITGNNVLMRPLPQSDERSYPLSYRLHNGDRLRVVGRADAKKPLAADWVKVISPPGTCGWIHAGQTEPVPAGEDVRAAWTSAVQSAQAAIAPFDLGTDAAPVAASAAVSASKGAPAVDLASEAEALMVAARAQANPDFTAAKAAYQRVIDQAPKSSAADMARLRLDEISAREEIERLKADSKLYEAKRQEELRAAESRLNAVSKKQDPLWGRFQARGWVEIQDDHYVVRWSGQTLAELTCSSGRYDLDTFREFEVGVTGVTVRSPVIGADGVATTPAKIDVSRLEVISGRPGT